MNILIKPFLGKYARNYHTKRLSLQSRHFTSAPLKGTEQNCRVEKITQQSIAKKRNAGSITGNQSGTCFRVGHSSCPNTEVGNQVKRHSADQGCKCNVGHFYVFQKVETQEDNQCDGTVNPEASK